jgi:glucose-6-phosphate dehydrogenase assembly protein OpcA
MPVKQSMKRSQSVDSFLSGRQAQVDVRKIEQELARLWTKASDSSGASESPQIVRACSANLILYSDREDAEIRDANILDQVMATHPCRAILSICRPAQERKLTAWVTARCRLATGPGAKQICSEQITVLAEGDLEIELVSVVESLLLGDLPVFLWWATADLSGDKLGPFLACTRRLIVDSAYAPYSFAYLRSLHQIVDSTSSCIAVTDLNWRRLLGIRSAIADEFERSPFSLADLKNIARVKVTCCGQELQGDDCSLQSLLFIGWLAGRLGWEPISFAKDSKTGSLACFEHEDRSIAVEFSSIEMSRVLPGSIFEIEIGLAGGRKLLISRDPAAEAGPLVATVFDNDKQIREVVADDSESDRIRLAEVELDEQGPDPVFEQSLDCASNLLRLLEVEANEG